MRSADAVRRAGAALLGLLLLATPAARAGEDPPGPLVRALRTVARDQKDLVTRWWPAEARRPGFAIPVAAGVVLAATSAPNGPDLRMERWFDRKVEHGSESVAEALTSAGNPAVLVAGLSAGALLARRGHPRFAGTCTRSLRAGLEALAWTEVLKKATARERPVFDRQGRLFRYGAEENGSFVSGHAGTSFAVARVFRERYRERPWVGRAAFGAAGLISLSRVAVGRHFPSDILVGAVVGDSIGRMVAQPEGAPGRVRQRGWHVAPAPDGLVLVIAWGRRPD